MYHTSPPLTPVTAPLLLLQRNKRQRTLHKKKSEKKKKNSFWNICLKRIPYILKSFFQNIFHEYWKTHFGNISWVSKIYLKKFHSAKLKFTSKHILYVSEILFQKLCFENCSVNLKILFWKAFRVFNLKVTYLESLWRWTKKLRGEGSKSLTIILPVWCIWSEFLAHTYRIVYTV